MDAGLLRERLFDPRLVAELRVVGETDEYIVFKMKRSRYWVRIPKKCTENIAYLAGVIAGDGNFAVSDRKTANYPRMRIRIYNASIPFLNLVLEKFRLEFHVDGKLHGREGVNCYELAVDNKITYLYFSRFLGLDKKHLTVPEDLRNPPLFRHFLAGFFDTDGYKTESFGSMIGGRNMDFLKELRHLTNEFYDLHFSEVRDGMLVQNGKTYHRCWMRLRKADIGNFHKAVPLQHEKYGPGRNRTGNLSRVRRTS